MSNSSLSLPPMSEPRLPSLLPAPFTQPQGLQFRRTAIRKLELLKSNSILFSAGLFSCTLLNTTPATIQLCCLQLQCTYAPKLQCLDYTITSNYWMYYKYTYLQTAALYNPNIQEQGQGSSHSYTSDIATRFTPRLSKPNTNTTEVFQVKYQALLLDFVVSNNLALYIVDSKLHHRLIQYYNISIPSISKSTLVCNLDKTFFSAQDTFKSELQEYIKGSS
jgi:hypothetical protein